jgi:hypothetical protein
LGLACLYSQGIKFAEFACRRQSSCFLDPERKLLLNMYLRMPALFSLVALSASVLTAADLATYRNFHLGMSFPDVAKQASLPASSEAQLISSRPERIEELDWHVNWAPPGAVQSNPFSEVLFRFYNGELFEMAVTYDRDQTRGLTETDMIEALSSVYGLAGKTVAAEVSFNAGGARRILKTIACWEDAQSQISLVHLPYGTNFGVVISSRANRALAEKAIVESERLDQVEAPRRELALRARQLADTQAADEKARALNKPGFRP